MGKRMTPRAGEPSHPFPNGWWGCEGRQVLTTNAIEKSSLVREGKPAFDLYVVL